MAALKKTALLFAVSLILLYLVIRKVGLAELLASLQQADPFWIAISVLLEPLLILSSVIRWRILIQSQGYPVSLSRLNGLYLIGKFFNNFLPSNVGGDVVRGYELGSYTKDLGAGMASVLVDRFTGFVMLVVMAIASLVISGRYGADLRISMAIIFSVICLLGVLWLALDTRLLKLVAGFEKAPLLKGVIPKLKKLQMNLRAYKDRKAALVQALAASFVFMTLAIANVYASTRAFYDEPVSFLQIAIIVPIVMVVAMIPLSLNGIGLEDWAVVLLFSWLGLPAAAGLSAVFLIRLKSILLAIVGGLIYPLYKSDLVQYLKTNEADRNNANIR
jgi:glycosyltransferase 2 family protein